MRFRLLAVAAALLIGGGVGTALAFTNDTPSEPAISEAAAIAAATAAVSGEVIEVELDEDAGAPTYEVEIDTGSGTVIEVLVDGATGDVVGQEVDDDTPGAPDDD